jgi:hypothetical protein
LGKKIKIASHSYLKSTAAAYTAAVSCERFVITVAGSGPLLGSSSECRQPNRLSLGRDNL